ncbi:hypothetical protein PENTCL1PPCAC_8500 [Pristionchus entomophagus]|uniref:Glycosyltransferase family 92 protein n=1 Tax=Pristionchus entomophagus TaxID=358040 RepID=A0AAV5T1W2_9BILA|nr:hypothetical protein PENTCL1PPCAC_8500 [Pristionchus entomophagus]
MEHAICSSLVFGKKYKREHLIEFVEMNKLMGAQIISLYVDYSSVDKQFIEAVRFYQRQGILDTVGFHASGKRIWYHGQLAMVMDCLVRHSAVTRCVAFRHLDEFIVVPNGKKVDVLPE